MTSANFSDYNEAVRQNGLRLRATEVFSMGGVASGTPVALASTATVSFTPSTMVTTHTPTQSETINFSTPPQAGTKVYLEVVTAGITSFTLTFGTNTKSQATLATGTVAAKTFMVEFISDGTNWVEVSRTTAM